MSTFKKLFESKDVEDLTHEVLIHHGFSKQSSYYLKGGEGGENDVYDTSHHETLQDIGWKVHRSFSYEDSDPDDSEKRVTYHCKIWHHPDHPDRSLTTQDVSWPPHLDGVFQDWTKHSVRMPIKGRETFQ